MKNEPNDTHFHSGSLFLVFHGNVLLIGVKIQLYIDTDIYGQCIHYIIGGGTKAKRSKAVFLVNILPAI